MSIKTRKASVREAAAEIVARNPAAVAEALTVRDLMEHVMVDPKDASQVLGDVDLCWSRMKIAVLPESIGELTVACACTKIGWSRSRSCFLAVGGDLYLEAN